MSNKREQVTVLLDLPLQQFVERNAAEEDRSVALRLRDDLTNAVCAWTAVRPVSIPAPHTTRIPRRDRSREPKNGPQHEFDLFTGASCRANHLEWPPARNFGGRPPRCYQRCPLTDSCKYD
jgi:hypothetical protein